MHLPCRFLTHAQSRPLRRRYSAEDGIRRNDQIERVSKAIAQRCAPQKMLDLDGGGRSSRTRLDPVVDLARVGLQVGAHQREQALIAICHKQLILVLLQLVVVALLPLQALEIFWQEQLRLYIMKLLKM